MCKDAYCRVKKLLRDDSQEMLGALKIYACTYQPLRMELCRVGVRQWIVYLVIRHGAIFSRIFSFAIKSGHLLFLNYMNRVGLISR
jgi:hypothetical protein